MSLFLTNSGASLVLATGGIPVLGSSPLERGEHPRLLFTADTLPAIRTKLSTYYQTGSGYDVAGTFQAAINELDASYGTITSDTYARWDVAAYALLYQIFKDGAVSGFTPGHTAIQYADEAIRLLQYPTHMGDGQWPYYNVSLAYDWVHERLRLQPSVQAAVAAVMTTASNDGMYTSPWAADACKEGSGEIISALALANDGVEDVWAAGKLAAWDTEVLSATGIVGEISRGLAPIEGAVSGSMLDNGNGYFAYEWAWLMLMGECYRTAYGLSKASFYDLTEWEAIPSGMYGLATRLRPYAHADGTYQNGYQWHLFRQQFNTDLVMTPVGSCAVIDPSVFAGIWNAVDPDAAALGMWMSRERVLYEAPTGLRIGKQWTLRFVLEDPTITPQSPADLSMALSQRYGDGLCLFRSDWESVNEGYAVVFWLCRYLFGQTPRHPALQQGHFEIHRKGPQTQQRSNHAHGDHGYPGLRNQVVVRETHRTVPMVAADIEACHGSVLRGNVVSAVQNQRGAVFSLGTDADLLGSAGLRTRFAASVTGIDYAFGDFTESYPGTRNVDAANPKDFNLYHRQLVFFRPPTIDDPVRVVVHDRVDVALSGGEPVFAWNATGLTFGVYQSNGSAATESAFTPMTGVSHGHRQSTNGWYIETVNQIETGTPDWDGKNRLTVILPTSRRIVIAGGPDESAQNYENGASYTTGSLESVDIYGQRMEHGLSTLDDPNTESAGNFGRWGAQIEPNPTSATTTFLVVNEVGDADMTPAVCEVLTSLTSLTGVAILAADGYCLAVFGSAGDTATGSFTVPSAGTYRTLIANLSANPTITPSNGSVANQSYDSASKTVLCDLTTNAANVSVSLS